MKEFISNGFAVADNENDPDIVAFRFASDVEGDLFIPIPRKQLPMVVAQILEKAPTVQITPISKSSLQPGKLISIDAAQVSANPAGGALVTLVATFPEDNRTVTIPFGLTASQASGLISDLAKALAAS